MKECVFCLTDIFAPAIFLWIESGLLRSRNLARIEKEETATRRGAYDMDTETGD